MLEHDLHSPELKQNKNNQSKTIKKKKAHEFGIEVGIGDSFRPGLILRKMGPEKY